MLYWHSWLYQQISKKRVSQPSMQKSHSIWQWPNVSIIRNRTTEGKKKIGTYKKKQGSTYCITTCAFWQMQKRHLMVSEMEPGYQSSKTAMLQTFICHLPNAEYSFILPVKFPWVPLCLPRTAPDCQGSMAHTEATPKLEHSSEITRAFAQVSQGLWGNSHCRSTPAIFKCRVCFCLSPNNHWTWNVWRNLRGTTADLHPWPQQIPSWLAERYRRGRSVTLCLPGWLFWMTPSQVLFTV